MRSNASVFRRSPAFSGASATTLKELALVSRLRTVARRAPLWSGKPSPVLVRAGVLRETLPTGTTIGFRTRGALLGADVLLGVRSGTLLEAHEDCSVLDVPAQDLERWLASDAALWRGLARSESRRRRELEASMACLAGPAPQRLAGVLVLLSKRFGVRDSRGTILDLRLTHRDLASLIGVTRETASLTVGQLRADGLIHAEGKRFVLLDKRALNRLASGR